MNTSFIKRLFQVIALLVLVTILFNSCICDCFDDCDKSIPVVFDTTSTTGYKISEIDTIIILAFDSTTSILPDTFIIPMSYNRFLFGYCTPDFGTDLYRDIDKIGRYYRHLDLITQNSDTFHIRDIYVSGHSDGDYFCSCFTLDELSLKIDGISYNNIQTNSDYPRKYMPTITLHRK